MFCNKCGKPIGDDDVFCAACGTKVVRVPETETTVVTEETLDIVEPASVEVNNVVEEIASDYISEEVIEPSIDEVVEEAEEPEMAPMVDETVSFRSEADTSETEVQTEFVEAVVEEPVIEESVIEEVVIEEPVVEEVESRETVFEEKIAVEEPAVAPVPDTSDAVSVEKPKKKKLASIHKRGAGAHIGATILSIILSVFLVLTMTIAILRSAVSEDTIADIFSNLELDEITVDETLRNDLADMGIVTDGDNILDIVYDNIDQDALKDPLTKEEFKKIADDEDVAEAIGEFLGKNIDSLIEGKAIELKPEDIVKLIEDEKDTIERVIGYEITEERLDNLRITLDENFADFFEDYKSLEIKSVVGSTASMVIDIVFADWLFILLIAIDVLFAILIMLIVHSFRLGFKYCGIVLVVIGSIFLAGSLFILFDGLELFMRGVIAKMITQVVGVVVWDLVIITASLVFVGVLMLLASMFIKKYLIRKYS